MRREHYRHVAASLIFGNPLPSETNRIAMGLAVMAAKGRGAKPEVLGSS
jgi:hypothetical protein